LTATIASGSVATAGMVVLPCSVNTLGKVAAAIADSLVTRAAHCQLKEGRKVVLCVREAPWTLLNTRNAERVAAAGGIIMPVSPPYYMVKGRNPDEVSMTELLGFYVDHVLSIFGQSAPKTWEDIR
jgi:4-hydroxy-3-polyprenylbenzoate decarboxylase